MSLGWLVGLLAAIWLCSNEIVETVRSEKGEDQCTYQIAADQADAVLSDGEKRPLISATTGGTATVRPRRRPSSFERPPGVPILQAAHPPRTTTPVMMVPSRLRPISRPTQNTSMRFGSLLLTQPDGQPFPEQRYLIVALDPAGRPAGVPLFNPSQARCTGMLGAASPQAQTLVEHQDPLGWRIAEGMDTAAGISDIPFAVHATFQVAGAHHHLHEVVENARPGALDAIGGWAKEAHIIPQTDAHTSILTGLHHGGAHLTAAGGSILNGLSLFMNGRQMLVSGQKMSQIAERQEEIWRESAEMTQEDYDAVMNQLDAVYEHNGRTVALSAAGATTSAIGGTLGVMALAGTTPAWAPPVAFGAAVAGAGVGLVSLGRMWFDQEPTIPSLLEVARNVDVNTSSVLALGNMDPIGSEEEGIPNISWDLNFKRWNEARNLEGNALAFLELGPRSQSIRPKKDKKIPVGTKIDEESSASHDPMKYYLRQVVQPRWNHIYALKHNMIPSYIDAIWRSLRKNFGATMDRVMIKDNFKITGALLPTAFSDPVDRAWLINLLQLIDHPDNKKWWVSPIDDAEAGEASYAWGSSEGTPVRKSATFQTEEGEPTLGDLCIDKGPSPDMYCEQGGHYMCDTLTFERGRVREGTGRCVEADYPKEAKRQKFVGNYGVIAELQGEDGEVAVLSVASDGVQRFRDYWARLHGFELDD